MGSKAARHRIILALCLLCVSRAQSSGHSDSRVDNRNDRWLDVAFAADSPVLPVSFSLRPTTARVVGSSMALDLHASLMLRNTSAKTLSGLTLRVEAQGLTPAGHGSVTIPSLRAQSGDVFPVRVDLQLIRPFAIATPASDDSAIVRVSLDCALFSDFSGYGPDQLRTRRSLVVYELEARRDRQYIADLLAAKRYAELREELNFGMDSVASPPGLELLRPFGPEDAHSRIEQRSVPVEVMPFRSSPVEAGNGLARIEGDQLRDSRIELRNRSPHAVRTIQLGWLVRDNRGKEFLMGLTPAMVSLGPAATGTAATVAVNRSALRFSPAAESAAAITSLMAFIGDVEFSDGRLWIPSRADIAASTPDPALRRVLTNSPEQQRLAQIYRNKGLDALALAVR